MSKTITVRLDDTVYEMFKKAAAGQKRTISNYVEYATLNYTVNDTIVDDAEMNEIMSFSDSLQKGLSDIRAGRYTIIDSL
jgi:predicted transcriptional regulator